MKHDMHVKKLENHKHLHHDHKGNSEKHHDHSIGLNNEKKKKENWILAIQATLHCLLGCGIGEIVGVIIGQFLGMGMWETMIFGMTLGFVFGFSLGIIPLIRNGFSFTSAFKTIFVSEGLSILVMESAEAIVQIFVPGIMDASLAQPMFWAGMAISLLAGFFAALPVNIYLIGKGIRHHH